MEKISTLEEITFEYEGNAYRIEAVEYDNHILIRIITKGNQVFPITFSISNSDDSDFYNQHKKSGYKTLMHYAKIIFIESLFNEGNKK